MRTQKVKILPLLLSATLSFFSVTNTFAEEEIGQNKQNSIVEHCDSIKDSLKATQRSDSHARTYLGSIYETVSSHFITPLNVRLVKTNKTNSELSQIQTTFVDARSNFNSSFISYSKSLEELISIDCKNSPINFYQKLQAVRKERLTVDERAKKLEQLISEHKQKVTELEQTL